MKGFTLIEMIVAVGIFMFVMMIAVGSLVAIVGADRKAQAIEAVTDNLRFAIDDISRTVRTGTNYYCGSSASQPSRFTSPQGTADCGSGGNYIVFLDQDGNIAAYWFNSACGGNGYGCIDRYVATFNPPNSWTQGVYLPITSSEVSITNMKFYVVGSARTSGYQPKVTVTLSAQIMQGPQATALNLQTTITQRIYNE